METLSEQINILNKKILALENKNCLEDIILKSSFKVLCFTGVANNTNLTLQNDLSEITNHNLIVKSFRIIPYYSADGIDISLTDGVTTSNETVYDKSRIERLFDMFDTGTNITFEINGGIAPIFTVPGANGYPLDLFIDNIFYKVPSILRSMNVRIKGTCIQDLSTGNDTNPNIKVLVECYIY